MLKRALLAALLAWPVVAHAAADTYEDCLETRAPADSGAAVVSLEATHRDGEVVRSRGTLYWRDASDEDRRLLLRMSAPEDIAGTEVLFLERAGEEPELYVYLPGRDKVRRMRGRALHRPLFGTDLTYADLERLRRAVSRAAVHQVALQQTLGRPVFVVEGRPDRGDRKDVEQVVAHVDRETCVPLRVEFRDRRERLLRVITVDPETVSREGETFLPGEVRVRNIGEQSETRLALLGVDVATVLPPERFAPETFGGGR